MCTENLQCALAWGANPTHFLGILWFVAFVLTVGALTLCVTSQNTSTLARSAWVRRCAGAMLAVVGYLTCIICAQLLMRVVHLPSEDRMILGIVLIAFPLILAAIVARIVYVFCNPNSYKPPNELGSAVDWDALIDV